MTSLLVMELTAAMGDLANNGIVSLAWISIQPWHAHLSFVCLDAIWQLRSNIWANWYTSGLYMAVSYT